MLALFPQDKKASLRRSHPTEDRDFDDDFTLSPTSWLSRGQPTKHARRSLLSDDDDSELARDAVPKRVTIAVCARIAPLRRSVFLACLVPQDKKAKTPLSAPERTVLASSLPLTSELSKVV